MVDSRFSLHFIKARIVTTTTDIVAIGLPITVYPSVIFFHWNASSRQPWSLLPLKFQPLSSLWHAESASSSLRPSPNLSSVWNGKSHHPPQDTRDHLPAFLSSVQHGKCHPRAWNPMPAYKSVAKLKFPPQPAAPSHTVAALSFCSGLRWRMFANRGAPMRA